MEKFIEVFDNVLPKYLENSYEEDLGSDPPSYPFEYTTNIAYGNTPLGSGKYSPGFSVPVYRDFTFDYKKCNPYYFQQILNCLGFRLKINILNIYKTKILMQIPSTNITHDDVHCDLPYPHWVCLYYINNSDGDTILFKDDQKTEIKRISPKKGRIVFFDGSIPHCSSPPTKDHRAIVNFNFIGEKL